MAKQNLPQINFNQSAAEMFVQLSGSWQTKDLAPAVERLNSLPLTQAKIHKIKIEFSSNFNCDTAGAWVLARWLKEIKQYKIPYDASELPTAVQHLLDKDYAIEPVTQRFTVADLIDLVGKKSLDFFENVMNNVTFFGEILVTFYRSLLSHNGMRWISISHHLQTGGIQALPIVGLISFLIGAVLAYQGINQLARFGASVYTVDFLAISLVREIAVLLTSVVIAGRSGSAFTAQIGTMALNQEIDAIRMLGLNPIAVLAIPRVIALTIALPLLVFFAIIWGLIGGMIITRFTIDMTFIQFWEAAQRSLTFSTFWVGMSKSPLFAIIIAVVGCYRGMQVKGSAESVGIMTTRSVVESIFMVIVCDALMSIFFSMIGI